MKERPILFSAPMVRAMLAGRKTQTRSLLKVPVDRNGFVQFKDGPLNVLDAECVERSPYGVPGDQLWVRETWGLHRMHDKRVFSELSPKVWYAADGTLDGTTLVGKWRPSIHMPRWASRITLEVTHVRVERLHVMSEMDAIHEGVERADGLWRGYEPERGPQHRQYMSPRRSFESLWNSINGADSWDANPWVWVVEFKRVTP